MPMLLSRWQHSDEDAQWMHQALRLADKASDLKEVPIGAVLVSGGQLVGSGFNQPIESCDPSAHAEVVAIREAASRIGNYRLSSCTLYVTLMPCLMCLGAILHSRIGRVVCGADDSRYAPDPHQFARFMNESNMAYSGFRLESGCMRQDCQKKLVDFFASRRRSRRALLAGLSDWASLPNVSKGLNELLLAKGIRPADACDEESLLIVQSRIAELLKTEGVSETAARLKSLKHFLTGSEARSWTSFLDDGPTFGGEQV